MSKRKESDDGPYQYTRRSVPNQCRPDGCEETAGCIHGQKALIAAPALSRCLSRIGLGTFGRLPRPVGLGCRIACKTARLFQFRCHSLRMWARRADSCPYPQSPPQENRPVGLGCRIACKTTRLLQFRCHLRLERDTLLSGSWWQCNWKALPCQKRSRCELPLPIRQGLSICAWLLLDERSTPPERTSHAMNRDSPYWESSGSMGDLNEMMA